MRALYLFFISIFLLGNLQAQFDKNNLKDEPSVIVKFAPRIFSPRIAVEKILKNNSSAGMEIRLYTYWIPQGAKVEGFYRKYFTNNAPFAPYVHVKAVAGGFGYGLIDFNNNISNNQTQGYCFGAGLNFGGQFNVGSKNAVIDVFGGFQVVPAIFTNVDYGFANLPDYKAINYITFSCPVEIGVRFGFVKNKKVLTYEQETTEPIY